MGHRITKGVAGVPHYANVALVYLRNIVASLLCFMDTLENFGAIAGLRGNWPKSCSFPLYQVPECDGGLPLSRLV